VSDDPPARPPDRPWRSDDPGEDRGPIEDARRARAAAVDRRSGREAPHPVEAGSVGVLGGTFDPVHVGHLAVAEEAREALGLETVLFLPNGVPPHKPDRTISAPEHRIAMVELAIADNPAFRLSRVEVDRTGPSYAVDTVETLARERLDAGRDPGLWWILSAEAFADLTSWREPARFLASCRLAVVPRPGARPPGRPWLEEHFPGLEDRVVFLDGPELGISSTLVRDRVAAGRSIRYLVPALVDEYIRDHHLYASELWRMS
jgi:nicotinate-nucleotide adenylyltransferase